LQFHSGVIQVLGPLWDKPSKFDQLIQIGRDHDVSVFLMEDGDCIVAVGDAWLQRAAIANTANKLAYDAYKGFLEFGRGAVVLSPFPPMETPETSDPIDSHTIYAAYSSEQQILETWFNLPAPLKLVSDLLLDKMERYDPATEAVVAFFFESAIILLQFNNFPVQPRDCYRRLNILEQCLS